MLATLKRIFDSVGNCSTHADHIHQTQVATVALLICIARADLEFGDSESETIVTAAKSLFGLSHEESEALIELAHQKQEASTSLYEFTAAINQHWDAQQKYELIGTLWAVAFADQDLDRHEEHLIRRIADLIHVPHMQFIQAKLEAQQGNRKC